MHTRQANNRVPIRIHTHTHGATRNGIIINTVHCHPSRLPLVVLHKRPTNTYENKQISANIQHEFGHLDKDKQQ